MNDNSVLDFSSDQSITLEKVGRVEKVLTIFVVSAIVINTLLFCTTTSGTGADAPQNFMISVMINVIIFNTLAAIFGSLVALFPYKKLIFRQKYLSAFLLMNSVMHSLQFIAIIVLSFFS
jgi:hypothetical protein